MLRLDSILQDLRYGLRSLRRAPIFAAVAVFSIAGGIAAGTGIFAVAYSILFRPLAVGDGREFYRVFTEGRSGGLYGGSSYADFESFREAGGALAALCATNDVRVTIRVGSEAALDQGELMSPGCFDALRLAPALGRFFSEATGTASEGAVPIVIGHTMWMRRFAGDLSAIGQVIDLNGMPMSVVAVAPEGFAGTSLDSGSEFWVPIAAAPVVLQPGVIQNRHARMFTIFARLRDGVAPAQAEAALAVVAARLREADSEAWTTATGATRRVTVMPETQARFAGAPGSPFALLAGAIAAIAVIVAIACLNLATMFLARGAARARELAIRLALGASRWRLVRQLATESLIVALFGAFIGLAATWTGLRLFAAYRPVEVPAFDVGFDWRILSFGILLAVAATLLFGVAPAVHSLRIALAEGMKGRPQSTRVRFGRFGARDALIVVQVAVSTGLLLVSTLFANALASGAPASPGFTVDGVAITTAHLDAITRSDVAAVTEHLLNTAKQVPDLDRVSLAGVVPMSGANIGFYAETDDRPRWVSYGNAISPGYFATLDIPLRRGRDFDPRDRQGAAPVVIVSDSLARQVWGTTEALGRTLIVDSVRREVVGVVADIRYRTFSEPMPPLLYVPNAQITASRFIVHARYRGGPATLAALDRALREAEPRVAIEGARPVRELMERALAPERAAKWVGATLGAVQLLLAVMALWGLVAYTVERRTNEMGVRLALGATPASLVRLTMRPAGVLILVGVAVGSALGVIFARIMHATSVGLAPLDMMAVFPVALAFTLVAMTAAWWPARRAGSADPVESLRRE